MPTDRFSGLVLGTNLSGTDNADGTITIDATGGGGGVLVGCKVYKYNNQTVNDTTTTVIQFDGEDFDTDGFHDNATNNTRLTVPTGLGGTYLVSFTIATTNGTGNNAVGSRQTRIWKNGIVNLLGSDQRPSASGIAADVAGVFVSQLADGDYIEFEYWQNSGGSLIAVGAGPGGPHRHIATLAMVKVG